MRHGFGRRILSPLLLLSLCSGTAQSQISFNDSRVYWVSWLQPMRFEAAAAGGLCAEISAGSKSAGRVLSQWPCAGVSGSLGGANQLWQPTLSGVRGRFRLRNQVSLLCVTASSTGTAITQQPCTNSSSQLWDVNPAPGGFFALRSVRRSLCVRPNTSQRHGAALILGACDLASIWKRRTGPEWPTYGLASHMQLITPKRTPDHHFWSSSFGFVSEGPAPFLGGYMGLQRGAILRDGTQIARATIFATWGASMRRNVASGGRCDDWDASDGPAEAAEGGYGTSCVVPYDWADESPRRFELHFSGYDNGWRTPRDSTRVPGKWWTAYVNGTRIADMFVPGRHHGSGALVHMLSGGGSFSEQFGERWCNQPFAEVRAEARFDPIYVWGAGGTSTVDTDPVDDNLRDFCPHQREIWQWDSALNSWGAVIFRLPVPYPL
jgi:hypothetical protein